MPTLVLLTAAAVAQEFEDDAALCLAAYSLFLAAVAHLFQRMLPAGGRARRSVAVLAFLPFSLSKFCAAVFVSSSPESFPLGDLMLFCVLSLVALQVPGDASAERARLLLEKLHFIAAAGFFASCPVGGKMADGSRRSFDVLVLFLAGEAVMYARLRASAGLPASRALSALLPFLLVRFGAAGAISASSLIYRIKVDALTASTVLLFRRAWIAGAIAGG